MKAWDDRMLARPGVMKGRNVPEKHKGKGLAKDPAKIKETIDANRAWIQAGMATDSKM